MKMNSAPLASQMLKTAKESDTGLLWLGCGLWSFTLFVQDVLSNHKVGCRNTGKNIFKFWVLPPCSLKYNMTAITLVTANSDITLDTILGCVW